ncbi:MAG TPA: hypothetical protein PLD25_31920 [Chloroflexota bacterium]|nr:hypothetical protein [Chloroflexota bacterium]HUM67568.1 hypothetical protein [Chloroflexota bacterium]
MTPFPNYQIRIAGLLDLSWTEWFDDLAITYIADDVTLLTGPLPDQAALHGVLNKIRDLGLTLLSVTVETAVTDDVRKQNSEDLLK